MKIGQNMNTTPSQKQKKRRSQLVAIIGATFTSLAALAPTVAQAETATNLIGSMVLTAGPTCPTGTLEAKGQSLNIRDHQALYSLTGLRFGGDRHTSFNLPNMADKAPVSGMRYCIRTDGIFPSRP